MHSNSSLKPTHAKLLSLQIRRLRQTTAQNFSANFRSCTWKAPASRSRLCRISHQNKGKPKRAVWSNGNLKLPLTNIKSSLLPRSLISREGGGGKIFTRSKKEVKSSSWVGGARWAPYKKYRRNNLEHFLPRSVGWEGHRMEVKKMCYQVKRILPTASRLIRFCGLQIHFTAFFISSRARLLSARLTWQRCWRRRRRRHSR